MVVVSSVVSVVSAGVPIILVTVPVSPASLRVLRARPTSFRRATLTTIRADWGIDAWLDLLASLVDGVDDRLSPVLQGFAVVLVPQFGDTVAEVNFYPALVHEDVVHPTVRHNALVFGLELHKRELQRISGLPVSDDLAGEHLAETRENNLEVFALSHWVEFADEQDVLWRFDIGLRQVVQHGQDLLPAFGLGFRLLFLEFKSGLGLRELIELYVVLQVDELLLVRLGHGPDLL